MSFVGMPAMANNWKEHTRMKNNRRIQEEILTCDRTSYSQLDKSILLLSYTSCAYTYIAAFKFDVASNYIAFLHYYCFNINSIIYKYICFKLNFRSKKCEECIAIELWAPKENLTIPFYTVSARNADKCIPFDICALRTL